MIKLEYELKIGDILPLKVSYVIATPQKKKNIV